MRKFSGPKADDPRIDSDVKTIELYRYKTEQDSKFMKWSFLSQMLVRDCYHKFLLEFLITNSCFFTNKRKMFQINYNTESEDRENPIKTDDYVITPSG